MNGDKGKRKNGVTHGSYGESGRGESQSSGIAVEFDRRDDPQVGVAWEKKSPATNVHVVDASEGDEGTVAHDGYRWRNLELPIFDSEDSMGWLTKIERYFWLRAVREEDKLEVVMVTMDEEALGWFQWWESWNPNHSCDRRTMQGFIGQFEKCVGMVKGLEEPFLVEVFLKG